MGEHFRGEHFKGEHLRVVVAAAEPGGDLVSALTLNVLQLLVVSVHLVGRDGTVSRD